MLMVTDMLSVAQGVRSASELPARSPDRFGAPAAPVIVWNVCRHCNMQCPHCYAAASLQPSAADLSTHEGLHLLDRLRALGVRVVVFSGGEPLLRGDLFQLLERAQQLGISAQLSTNGVLIDVSTATRLASAGVAYVGASLDGMPEWNDQYRGFAGGFERVLGALDQVRARGMKAGLRVTVTRRNASMVPALLSIAQQRQIERFYVSHLVYAGRGRKLQADDLTPGQTRALLWQLFDAADSSVRAGERQQIVTGGNDSAGPLLLQFVGERYGLGARARVRALLKARGGNSAGERILNIDHRGNVHPDQFWQQHAFGNVRTHSLSQIMEHPLREALKNREALLEGRCAGCSWKELCRGSHRERALVATGSMWGPDPACVLRDDELATETREEHAVCGA